MRHESNATRGRATGVYALAHRAVRANTKHGTPSGTRQWSRRRHVAQSIALVSSSRRALFASDLECFSGPPQTHAACTSDRRRSNDSTDVSLTLPLCLATSVIPCCTHVRTVIRLCFSARMHAARTKRIDCRKGAETKNDSLSKLPRYDAIFAL
jgi:hypothetical protein